MMGPQAFLPQFLISFHKMNEERDMEAYSARIGGVARAMDQLLERARVHAAEGVRPPRFGNRFDIKGFHDTVLVAVRCRWRSWSTASTIGSRARR